MMHLIMTYGYIGLFIGLTLEYFILVVPGETLLTTVGIASNSGSIHMNMFALVMATGLGTFTGSMIAYFVGRLFGRPLLERYGKYVMLTPKRLEQSEAMFQRYTWIMLIISRYIAVVRDIVPYIAGINRTRLVVYVPIMLLSSILWTSTFLVLGGFVGQVWHAFIHHWKADLAPAVLIVCAAVALYVWIHRKLHKWVDSAEKPAVVTQTGDESDQLGL